LTSSLDGYQTVTLQNVTVVANEITPVTITLDPVHNEDANAVSLPLLLSIYPNPAKNFFTLDMNKSVRKGELRVYNLKGELVLKLELSNQKSAQLDISSLPAGIFLLKVKADSLSYIRKLIKS